MIENLLKQLGFNDKEIKIYLTILEQGKTTPAKISRLTNINRSTVYSISKELLDKGVIVEDLGGSSTYLVALPPEELKSLIKKDERKLENKKALVEEAIVELRSYTKNTKYSIPKITFIYEEDIEDFLYKQAAEWSKSIMSHDSVWWGFQDPSFVEKYSKWIDWFWKETAPKDLLLKLLTNESLLEKEIAKRGYERRLTKVWKKGKNFTSTTWINGDYLILIMTQQHPHYLVQIHDPSLAHNMREMFKDIWENQN